MKHRNEFSNNEEHEHKVEQQSQSGTPVEFASPEDMLRYDAKRIPIPPTIADRLRESLGAEPVPRRSWWRRWLGK